MDFLMELDEQQLLELLQRFRALGPLPGLLLPFLKSFVPPLPTIVIVGGNAAVYGLWLGFLYSWIGIVAGCVTSFLIVRRFSDLPFLRRYMKLSKVQRSLVWIRRNAFSYVFILSLFPVGPFIVINVVAGFVRMRFASFLIAIACGKAVMVFAVTLIGHDIGHFLRNPLQIGYVVLFVLLSLWLSKKLERKFAQPQETSHGE